MNNRISHLAALILFFIVQVNGQPSLPFFLEGTWKAEDKEHFEHWDLLNDGQMKGLAYIKDSKGMRVSEYLEISSQEGQVVYTASVLNQNNGNAIPFTGALSGGRWVFENMDHDFPKRITYQLVDEVTIEIEISDADQTGLVYRMRKQLPSIARLDSTVTNVNFDPELARTLEADDYGMKRFTLVLLKTGPSKVEDQAFIQQCFRGHLDNINRLVDQGKLIVAGPLSPNERTYRGIFILTETDMDQAKILLQSDPAIAEGLLDYELFLWYGSAALPVYLDYSDKIWKTKP